DDAVDPIPFGTELLDVVLPHLADPRVADAFDRLGLDGLGRGHDGDVSGVSPGPFASARDLFADRRQVRDEGVGRGVVRHVTQANRNQQSGTGGTGGTPATNQGR